MQTQQWKQSHLSPAPSPEFGFVPRRNLINQISVFLSAFPSLSPPFHLLHCVASPPPLPHLNPIGFLCPGAFASSLWSQRAHQLHRHV